MLALPGRGETRYINVNVLPATRTFIQQAISACCQSDFSHSVSLFSVWSNRASLGSCESSVWQWQMGLPQASAHPTTTSELGLATGRPLGREKPWEGRPCPGLLVQQRYLLGAGLGSAWSTSLLPSFHHPACP